MRRKGFVHIGLPKTGTTSIQNALFTERQLLLCKCGILYPSIDANHTTPLCTMFLQDPRQHVANKVAGLASARDFSALIDSYNSEFLSEAESSNYHTLVLSAEGLSNLNLQEVVKFKGWLDQLAESWVVLAWIRHPVDLTRSVTQQLLKNGYTLDYLEERPILPNFKGKLSIWANVFGLHNIRILNYEETIAEAGGIIRAFCAAVGIPPEISQIVEGGARWENKALSQEAAELLSSLNKQRPLFGAHGINERRTGTELQTLGKIPGRKFDLSPSCRRSIKHRCREDVEWINQTFSLNVYTDVFLDDDKDVPVANGTSWSEETVDAIVLGLSDLINAVHCNSEMAKGNQALQKGRLGDALEHYKKAHRVCPDIEGPTTQMAIVKDRMAKDGTGVLP